MEVLAICLTVLALAVVVGAGYMGWLFFKSHRQLLEGMARAQSQMLAAVLSHSVGDPRVTTSAMSEILRMHRPAPQPTPPDLTPDGPGPLGAGEVASPGIPWGN